MTAPRRKPSLPPLPPERAHAPDWRPRRTRGARPDPVCEVLIDRGVRTPVMRRPTPRALSRLPPHLREAARVYAMAVEGVEAGAGGYFGPGSENFALPSAGGGSSGDIATCQQERALRAVTFLARLDAALGRGVVALARPSGADGPAPRARLPIARLVRWVAVEGTTFAEVAERIGATPHRRTEKALMAALRLGLGRIAEAAGLATSAEPRPRRR